MYLYASLCLYVCICGHVCVICTCVPVYLCTCAWCLSACGSCVCMVARPVTRLVSVLGALTDVLEAVLEGNLS